MLYRRSVCMFLALMMADGAAVQALAASDQNVVMDQAETDLTGHWRQGDGHIVYFTQVGSSLTSRYSKSPTSNVENEVDFTATIYGNLIYGAHRASFSHALQEKCSNQIWVGMGLTLNETRTELTGFRGDRIVDPESCSVEDSDPVGIIYIRIHPPES